MMQKFTGTVAHGKGGVLFSGRHAVNRNPTFRFVNGTLQNIFKKVA
jgi:hypothetical protein